LENIETILSNYRIRLLNNSIDIVLLYYKFHDLDNPNEVLKELHRVLKPNGILSFSDHHMKENEIVAKITSGGLFRILRKCKRTFGTRLKIGDVVYLGKEGGIYIEIAI